MLRRGGLRGLMFRKGGPRGGRVMDKARTNLSVANEEQLSRGGPRGLMQSRGGPRGAWDMDKARKNLSRAKVSS